MSNISTYVKHYEIYRVLKKYKTKVLDVMEFFNSYAFFLGQPERQRMYDIWNAERLKIETLITQFSSLSNEDDINSFIGSKLYIGIGEDLGGGTFKYKTHLFNGQVIDQEQYFTSLSPKE